MKNLIKKYGIDKVYHLIAGFIIAENLTVVLNHFMSNYIACLIAFILTGIIGVLKEVWWDGVLGKGHVENNDSYATTLGGLIGALVILILG